MGRGGLPLPHPRPLMSGAGGKADPVIIRVGNLYWTTTSCNNEENKACTSPGEYNRASHVSSGVGEPAPIRDEFSLLFLISHVGTGYVVSEKTGFMFIRLGELSLKNTRCNTQLSCQCTTPGQRNRDNPVSRGAGEPAPNSEHVIAVESTHLFGDGMCEGELPSSSLYSSKPGEDGSADSVVIST